MLGLREVQQHDCDAFVLACVDVVITVCYQKERDPWSNPPGIDRPEGGLKTQSAHITHILPTALQSTVYRVALLYTRAC